MNFPAKSLLQASRQLVGVTSHTRFTFWNESTSKKLFLIRSEFENTKLNFQESDHEEEERRRREKEKRKEEKRREHKSKSRDSGTLDPMDPASYSDTPRGNWSSGLDKEDGGRAIHGPTQGDV